MVRVGRDLEDHLVPTALSWAGTSSTRPGCSELHPTWPWTLLLHWMSPSCGSDHALCFLRLPKAGCKRRLSWCSSTAPRFLFPSGRAGSQGSGLRGEPGCRAGDLEPLKGQWCLEVGASFSLRWRQGLFPNLDFSRAQKSQGKDVLWFK